MTRPSPFTASRRRAAGFTMLEILVTLLIVALGILGIAGMQALALKMNKGGQLRSQAVILGMDLLERIEANNPGAIAGSYAPATLPTAFTKDCAAEYCLPSELATYDLVELRTRLEAQLPGATFSVTFSGSGPYTYTLQLDWEERISRGGTTALVTSGATNVGATGMTERFSFTITRMYPDRSIVV